MTLDHIVDDGVELFTPGLEDGVVVILADTGTVGGNGDNIQLVDLVELSRFRFSSTGHTGKFCVHAEVVLDRNGRHGLCFLFDRNIFLGFQCLMESVRETASGHETTGVFVNDQHLAVLDHIVHILLKEAERLEELGKIVELFALVGKVLLELLFFRHFFGGAHGAVIFDLADFTQKIRHHKGVGIVGFDGVSALGGQVSFVGLLINGEIKVALDLLQHTPVVVAADLRLVAVQFLEDAAVLQKPEQLFMGGHTETHLKQFPQSSFQLFIRSVFVGDDLFCLFGKSGAEFVLLFVE